MTDSFLLITPLLLLIIVALFGFVGCNWVFGIEPTKLAQPPKIDGLTPDVGSPAGGTSVTITGSDFVSTPTVTFGGTPGTDVTSSDSEIKVTTPAHSPGTVDVVVTNPDNESATSSQAFTFQQVQLAQPVQATQQSGAPPISVVLPNAQAGSLIVVTVSWGLAGTMAITDTVTNTYQSAGNGNWSGRQAQMFYAMNQVTGTLTVTAAGAGTTGPSVICVAEYVNADASAPLYEFKAQASPSVGGALNVMLTSMKAGDLIYAVAFAQNGNLMASGGFMAEGSSTLGTMSLLAADEVVVTPGATAVGIVNGNMSAWVILAAVIALG